MTIDHSAELRVPAWVLTIVTPILIGVIAYVIGLTTIKLRKTLITYGKNQDH